MVEGDAAGDDPPRSTTSRSSPSGSGDRDPRHRPGRGREAGDGPPRRLGWGVSGLERIDGKVSQDNETTHRGWRFVNGRRATITCEVRKGGVAVTCDGKRIVDWRGDPGRLSLVEGWRGP